ncbi:MAG: DUF2905 domain-containing protein [Chloroflexota bacterium]|nr:DUF2905 domain-containing protein [Chloroflexota bacterium]
MPPEIGRIILIVGVILVVLGGLAVLGIKVPIGRLPGDIAITGKNGGFYFPITTMLLASLLLTVLWNLFTRR